MIARCTFGDGERHVEIVPCTADRLERPIAYQAESRTGKTILAYLREANEIAGIATVFRIDPSGRYVVAQAG